MTRKKKQERPFGVNLCGVCDHYAVTATVGGGVHYCRECVRQTLGWVQFTPDQRTKLLALYDAVAAMPSIKTLLGLSALVDEDTRKAIAIGDSKRRMMEAER